MRSPFQALTSSVSFHSSPSPTADDLVTDLAGLNATTTTNTNTTTTTTTTLADAMAARRSARAAAVAARAAAAADTGAAAAPAVPGVRVSGRRNPPTAGSADAAIQALLMLPGFAWEEDLSWCVYVLYLFHLVFLSSSCHPSINYGTLSFETIWLGETIIW